LLSKNEELISKQADNFMSIIAEMHSSGGDELEDSISSSFMVVPAALALHSLLERNWKPRHMSLSVISSLAKVLGNLASSTVNDVERKRAADAITAILASATLIGADAAEIVFNSVTDSIREISIRCSNSESRINSAEKSVADSHHELPRPSKPSEHMDATMAHLFLVAEVLKQESGVESLPFSSPTQSIFHKDIVNIIFGPAFVASMCSSREMTVFDGNNTCSNNKNSSGSLSKNDESCVISSGLCSLLEVVFKIKRARNNNSIVVKDLQLDVLQKAEVYFNINSMAEASLPETPVRTSRGMRNIWRKDEPISVGDLVDAMDKEKFWYESIVTELRPGMNVKVHFMGWGSRWDDVIDLKEIDSRIAPLNTKTANWRADLFEGGLIEIKCNEDTFNQKWMWGRILALNIDEAWVDVSYSFSNEPTMVKRVDLYGENICPVGMHTKEKSKAVAATIVRPPKRTDELMRSKREESYTEEAAFWDREDDLVDDPLNDSMQQQAAPLLMRVPTIITTDSFSSPIDHVACIMFESIMYEVISAVTESIPLRLDDVPVLEHSSRKTETVTEGKARVSGVAPSHHYNAALKVLLAIGKGPFKRLLAPYFCRILTVHCGLRAKISVAASLALATNDIVDVAESLAPTSSLMQRVRGLESLYCELLIRCLGDILSLPILRRMLLRVQTTVSRCAVAPIAKNFISRATSKGGGLSKALENEFLKSDRFSNNATELRKVLSKIFQAASQSDLVRISDVWKNVLESWLHTECIPSSGISNNNQEEHYKSILSSLILMLDKARSISRLEFQETNLCHMAADEAFKNAFSCLPTCTIMHLSKAMAVTISSLLDRSEVGMYPDKRTKMLDSTCDFLQTVLTEETYEDFKRYYELLLSRRLLQGRFTSLSSEKSVLAHLPDMPKAHFMIRHFELGQRYMIEFRKHLMTRVDADLLEYSPSIKLALEPGGKLNICVISGSLWPIKCVSPSRYAALSLPRELEVLTREFGVFFDSLDLDSFSSSSHLSSRCATPRRLFWCFGAGSVTLACRLYDQMAATIVVNEPQAAVLLAYNKRANACFSASELCKLTNLGEDLVQEMLKTLSHPSMPLLEFRNTRSSKGTQNQNDAENSGKYFLSESMLSGVLGRSGEEEETLFVSQGSLIDLPSAQEWKNTTVDACIVKVLKQTARDGTGTFKGLEGVMVIETALSAYQTALIVRQRLKATEKMRGQVSTEYIMVRCQRLVDDGYIERLGGSGGVDLDSFGFSYLPESIFSSSSSSSFSTQSLHKSKSAFGGSDEGEGLFRHMLDTLSINNSAIDLAECVVDESLFLSAFVRWIAKTQLLEGKKMNNSVFQAFSFPLNGAASSLSSNNKRVFDKIDGPSNFPLASNDSSGGKSNNSNNDTFCSSRYGEHVFHNASRDVVGVKRSLIYTLGACVSQIIKLQMQHHSCITSDRCRDEKNEEAELERYTNALGSASSKLFSTCCDYVDVFQAVVEQLEPKWLQAALLFLEAIENESSCSEDKEGEKPVDLQETPFLSRFRANWNIKRGVSVAKLSKFGHAHFSDDFVTILGQIGASYDSAALRDQLDGEGTALKLASKSICTSPVVAAADEEAKFTYDPQLQHHTSAGRSIERDESSNSSSKHDPPVVGDSVIFLDLRDVFLATMEVARIDKSREGSDDPFRSPPIFFGASGKETATSNTQQIGSHHAPAMIFPDVNFFNPQVFPRPSFSSASSLEFFANKTDKKRSAKARLSRQGLQMLSASARQQLQQQQQFGEKQVEFPAPAFSYRKDEKQSTEGFSLFWQLREYLSLCRTNFERQFATLLNSTSANDVVTAREFQYQEQQSEYKEDEVQFLVPLASLLLDKLSALVAEDVCGIQSRADDSKSDCKSDCGKEKEYSVHGTQTFEPLVSNMLKAAFRSMSSNGLMSVASFAPSRYADGLTKAEAEQEEIKQRFASARDEEMDSPAAFCSNFGDSQQEIEELDASSSSWALLKDDQKNKGSVLDYNFSLTSLPQGDEDEKSVVLACQEQLSMRVSKLRSVLRESNLSILSLLASSDWDVRKVLDVYCESEATSNTTNMLRSPFLTMPVSTHKSKPSVLFQSTCAAFISTSQLSANTDLAQVTDPKCVRCCNDRKPTDIVALCCHHWCCKECWKNHFTDRAVQGQENTLAFVFICVECNTPASPGFVGEILGKSNAAQGVLYKAIFEDQAKAFLSFLREKENVSLRCGGSLEQEIEKETEFAFHDSQTASKALSSFRFGIAPLCSALSFSSSTSQIGDMQACREAVASMRLHSDSYKSTLNEPIRKILISCLSTLSKLSLTGNQRNLCSLGVASDLASVMKQYCLADPQVAETLLVSLNSFCFGNAVNIHKAILGLVDDEHSLFLLLEWYSNKPNRNIRILHSWSMVVCDTLLGIESNEENRNMLQQSFRQYRFPFLDEPHEDERLIQVVAKIRSAFFPK